MTRSLVIVLGKPGLAKQNARALAGAGDSIPMFGGLGMPQKGGSSRGNVSNLLRETNQPDHSLRTKSRIFLSLYWIRWLFARYISALSASYSGNSRWIDCGSMILSVGVSNSYSLNYLLKWGRIPSFNTLMESLIIPRVRGRHHLRRNHRR